MPANERRLLIILVLALAPAASFGFWGENLGLGITIAQRALRSDPWLDEPLQPTIEMPLDSLFATSAASARNPFLTAAEWRPVEAHRPAVTTVSVDESWPELDAIITFNGQPTAVIGGSPARPGEKTEGVEVLKIDGRRVLVKREEGSQWLYLTTP